MLFLRIKKSINNFVTNIFNDICISQYNVILFTRIDRMSLKCIFKIKQNLFINTRRVKVRCFCFTPRRQPSWFVRITEPLNY